MSKMTAMLCQERMLLCPFSNFDAEYDFHWLFCLQKLWIAELGCPLLPFKGGKKNKAGSQLLIGLISMIVNNHL